MSTPTASSATPTKALPPAPTALVCPEDLSIWTRYSSHHEFPLSVATSVVVHLFVAMLFALSSVWMFKFDDRATLIEMVIFEQGGSGGAGQGGGDPHAAVKPQEAKSFEDDPESATALQFDPLKLPTAELDPTQMRLQAARESDELTKGLRDPSRIIGNEGRGGPGAGGGQGRGIGRRDGDGMGDGRGQPSKRMARKDRWIIVLPLQDHAQFMRKLAELQTIILVPDAPGRFRLYTAWSSGQAPVHTVVTVEGIRDLNRIWYTNTDAEVCVGVAKQLGLDTTPNYIAIFVPQELEREMAKKELEYRQLSEEQIVQEKLETVFDVMRSGAQFVVKVREQKPRSQ